MGELDFSDQNPIVILRLTRTYPLAAFFLLAYGFSWLAALPRLAGWITGFPFDILIGGMGPALAGLWVTGVTEGRVGILNLLGGVSRWRVGLRWWSFALLFFPLLMLLAIGVMRLAGIDLGGSLGGKLPSNWLLLPLLGGVLLAALVEEIGWRGYAWPRLLQRHRLLPAGVILGILWACWHLPLFFIKGMPQANLPFLPYLIMTIAVSIWLGWLYSRTQSILLATVCHASLNGAGAFPGSDSMPALAMFTGLGLILAAGLVFLSRTKRSG